MGGGLVDVRGIAIPGDVAEETVRMRLVATSYLGAGELEEAASKRACLVHAADEKQGLAQLGEDERAQRCAVSRGYGLQHLVEESLGLRGASGESIRCAPLQSPPVRPDTRQVCYGQPRQAG
jgi:hypothetical protein